MTVNDPEQQIEADAAELEERIGRLDSNIGEAKQAADARPGENPPLDTEDDGDGDADGFDDPEAEEEEDE